MANVIPLDGPASSGKTSVGQAFADKIGYLFVDSGLIYRASAKAILENGTDLSDETALANSLKLVNLKLKPVNNQIRLILDDEDVTDTLHDQDVTMVVSTLAKYPKVRELLTQIQRQLCDQQDTVLSGRDGGTVVYPDARLKFFITARPEVRAQRRFEQLKQKDQDITFIRVYSEIMQRDEEDSTREASPLMIPEGAVVIDNSDKSIDQIVSEMVTEYRKVLA